MAYAALVSFSQTIDLILKNHQDSISSQVKDQVITIHKYVNFLQAFLEDFPDKANNLEARIREVTLVVEDIIEFVMIEQIHESRNASLESSVGRSKSKYEYFPYGLHDVQKLTKEIECIVEQVMEIKTSITVKDARLGCSTAASSSSRAAPINKAAMVGLENDLMEIKSRLCGESPKLQVIPITGMGGVGKTTLARYTYNDLLIVEHFDIRVWVTISQDYSAREIVSSLLVSMKGEDAKSESMKEQKVYQNLKGRRYLIVLDDIWSVKAWYDLKVMFPDDGNGSRIMLTTRLLDVAKYVDSTSPVHEMRLLDDDQSWNLLRQEVFKHNHFPVELENVGKMIARSCKGLPLAIVVISGILVVDQTKAAWENIAKNVKSAISANDEQFDKILSLSYTHLPHHLRPCVLYMGGFPEDYEICASKLFKLWVAEGFLKPNGCKSFEEAAEECLEDLVRRSLVWVTERKSNGRIKSISTHDLVRDMCIRKAQEENFFLHGSTFLQEGIKSPRRVSVSNSDSFLGRVDDSTIRTIVCLVRRGEGKRWYSPYFRLLRILDLVNACQFFFQNDGSLPAEVFELFHLRYLAFDYPFRIPKAISNLQNLQTFIARTKNDWKYYVHGPYSFILAPLEIQRMPQLRHLVMFCFLSPLLEEATFALENLQTLSVAINFICTPKILKMIPNLKKLGIVYRSWKSDEEYYFGDYYLHNLIYLQHLENLRLSIYDGFPFPEKVKPAFPRTLKELTLGPWGRPWKDLKIVGSLPNLEVLKLKDYACIDTTWETTEGEFSQLKCLMIDKSYLQHWITESSHFPRLKHIVLYCCQILYEIPNGFGEIPTLELIEVDYLNEKLVKSAKQIQDDQQSCGNNALQVRQISKRWRI